MDKDSKFIAEQVGFTDWIALSFRKLEKSMLSLYYSDEKGVLRYALQRNGEQTKITFLFETL